MRVACVLCLCAALVAACATATEVSGPIRVLDGDTLDIAGDRVRLGGIDAFERDQTCGAIPCGQAARTALLELVSAGGVQCTAEGRDRYGRHVGRCRQAGRDIGGVMVASGWALADPRYGARYAALEAQARAAGRGAWAAPAVLPPWLHRRTASQPPPAPGCAVKGNISRSGARIYHLPGTLHYDRTRISPEAGERWFCSRAEAEAAGWRAPRG